jgi:hypothetical protein
MLSWRPSFSADHSSFFSVSQDCFRDAARELAECPEVAIIQHDSGECVLPRVRPKYPNLFLS